MVRAFLFDLQILELADQYMETVMQVRGKRRKVGDGLKVPYYLVW
jgi:hypothetical protein